MLVRRGARIGRYQIEGLLGQGGMGQVHVALDTSTGQRVALKTVQRRGELAPDATTHLRLLREARAAAVLAHPNAVAVVDIGEHADVTFVAMELVQGRPLRAFVGDAGVPLASKVRWLHDIASVLAEAHRLGLVHRDVKPDNVVVRDDGVAKMLDFGIVKRVAVPGGEARERTHDLTAEGMILGTPRYMPPEAFEGFIGPASDQFAWGAMAYELLSGTHPFLAPPNVPQYEWLLRTVPKPLAALAPETPAHVAATITRALAKSRDRRHASMLDIVRALESS
ncbi:MAG: serine/threonine protein kinase [Deltaproteobacteria bacterium]|nr:serine/threonine protein kinase [Deltaproteobacteria bacterium]